MRRVACVCIKLFIETSRYQSSGSICGVASEARLEYISRARNTYSQVKLQNRKVRNKLVLLRLNILTEFLKECEMENGKVRRNSDSRYYSRVPRKISKVIERIFFRIGFKIATQPYKWLIASTLVIFICLSGLYFFRQEKDPLKLWVPPDSEFVQDTRYLLSHFESGLQIETLLLTADNVLEPDILIRLNQLTKKVMDAQFNGVAWSDVCLRVPSIAGILSRKKRSDTSDDFFDSEPGIDMNQTIFEPSIHADAKLYCQVVNSLPKVCFINSILDIWDYDNTKLKYETKETIVERLHRAKISPTLGFPTNFSDLLSGVIKDQNGKIISAKAVKTQWLVHTNFTGINTNEFGNKAGTAEWVLKVSCDLEHSQINYLIQYRSEPSEIQITDDVLAWEAAFINALKESKLELENAEENNETINIYFEATRSFGDITETTIFQDMDKIVIGIFLMFIYVLLILSEPNWVELRFWLTIAGLLCIAGAFIIAIGVCSFVGVPYGPVHTSLPFMLLGLGIDDIFIMSASWKEVHDDKVNRNKSLPERIGMMLGHAGSAICITSLTDVVAFIIGTFTIFPSLESFCIYAVVGVFVTLLLQVTYFVGFFTLDMQRIENKRNSIFPWIIHANHTTKLKDPNEALSAKFIKKFYSKVILTKFGKILVVVITGSIASVAVVGSLQLEQWFDPYWFLPSNSYLNEYNTAHKLYYPDRGYDAFVIVGDVDYTKEFPKIITLVERIQNLTTIQNIEPWPIHFADFIRKHFQKDLRTSILSEDEFSDYLSKFLHSRIGGKYQSNIQFERDLLCGERAPKISVSTVSFTFKPFSSPHEWIPAMDQTKQLTKEAEISGFVTVWSKMFSVWLTDKLISREVTRNVALALLCVGVMTALLIAEPQTCVWIFLCVLLTLLDVCGFMYFWGLTIDIVSCIALELSIGLSIDYSAHVAHAYLNAPAGHINLLDRQARALRAITYTGAAVAFGAGSTLLALSMMLFSKAYIFHSFLKIFFLVILFGMWHGVVFLPVILSTIGPRSLRYRQTEDSCEKVEMMPCASNTTTVDLVQQTQD